MLNNGLMEHTLPKRAAPRIFDCGEPGACEPAAAPRAAPRRPEIVETALLLGRIARAEGAAGLYAGLGPTLAMAVPNTVLYFTAYDELRRALGDLAAAPAVAGAAARCLATAAVAPFELARTQLQALPPEGRGAYGAALRRTVAARGAASLWRGLGSTLWRDVPFSACYWLAYERLRGGARRHDGAAAAGAAGVAAGALAALATTPFDVAKTRAMVDAHLDRGGDRSTWENMRTIARAEGPRALLAGAAPRLLKVAPACGIMIGSYEYAKAAFAGA